MELYTLLLGLFGVWRISHLLSEESGPEHVFTRLRRLCGNGFWGQLFGCFYCISVWVAALFAVLLVHGWKERALLWPALSGGAILLERLSTERVQISPGVYFEETENEHVLR
jgi:hypothetical protein